MGARISSSCWNGYSSSGTASEMSHDAQMTSTRSYIHKAMLIDVGRRSDPVLAEKSMRLPKGMSVYDIMRECDLGVFEARIVQSLIV